MAVLGVILPRRATNMSSVSDVLTSGQLEAQYTTNYLTTYTTLVETTTVLAIGSSTPTVVSSSKEFTQSTTSWIFASNRPSIQATESQSAPSVSRNWNETTSASNDVKVAEAMVSASSRTAAQPSSKPRQLVHRVVTELVSDITQATNSTSKQFTTNELFEMQVDFWNAFLWPSNFGQAEIINSTFFAENVSPKISNLACCCKAHFLFVDSRTRGYNADLRRQRTQH
jgi:hypothetical protein